MTGLDNLPSLRAMGPELALFAGIVLILVVDLFSRGADKIWGHLAIAFLALSYSGARALSFLAHHDTPRLLFSGLLAADPFASLFRVLFPLCAMAVLALAYPAQRALSLAARGRELDRLAFGEFTALVLSVTLGLNLMVMSHHTLLLYLSLEMVSVVSFVLAGYAPTGRRSSEAALKYVLFGAVSSGIMLYGLSLLYGLTGTLDFAESGRQVAAIVSAAGRTPPLLFFAIACVFCGIGYKLGAVPFHMWTPDVYEGAPTEVTAFLSVGPKAAGFALLIRFLATVVTPPTSAAAPVLWPVLLGVVAVATMTLGNLTALRQESVKRMLAYSSIAHAGYMLLGLAAFRDSGALAVVFYLFTYCSMSVAAFAMVLAVAAQSNGDESLLAFRGLSQRSPVLAACFAGVLFSLAGLPPFVGFAGKLYVFAALVSALLSTSRTEGLFDGASVVVSPSWLWGLCLAGVINGVISLVYYARILRTMYLDKAEHRELLQVHPLHRALVVLLAAPALALGVYWGPLYDVLHRCMFLVR